jgi:translation elongation factor P/translation initiation factor 5A
MNYVTFRTIEIDKNIFIQRKKIMKENKECFIMYKNILFLHESSK